MGQARIRQQKRIARPRAELVTKLAEQLDFIERSATAFDDGVEHEAARIATSLRILLHDEGMGDALLRLLDIPLSTTFMDTAHDLRTDERRLDGTTVTSILRPASGLTGFTLDADGARFFPHLGETSAAVRWIPYRAWWNKPVIGHRHSQVSLDDPTISGATRRDLVLWLANTDGGAHVDAGLDPKHDALLRDYRQGIKLVVEDPDTGDSVEHVLSTPIYAAVRQIGYEVNETLRTHGLSPATAAVLE